MIITSTRDARLGTTGPQDQLGAWPPARGAGGSALPTDRW